MAYTCNGCLRHQGSYQKPDRVRSFKPDLVSLRRQVLNLPIWGKEKGRPKAMENLLYCPPCADWMRDHKPHYQPVIATDETQLPPKHRPGRVVKEPTDISLDKDGRDFDYDRGERRHPFDEPRPRRQIAGWSR